MNVHDGIPFVKFGDTGDSWFINPIHIVRVCDLSKDQCKAKKYEHPTCSIYLINSPEPVYLRGLAASDVEERITKTMLNWREKLVEKALLT